MSFNISGGGEPPRDGPGFIGTAGIMIAGFVGAMVLLCSGFMGSSLQHMGFMLALVIFGPFVLIFLVMLNRARARKARGE